MRDIVRWLGDSLQAALHPYLNKKFVTRIACDNGNGAVHYVFICSLYSDDLDSSQVAAMYRGHTALESAADKAIATLCSSCEVVQADSENQAGFDCEPYTGSDGL